jgi:hypothetical protein
MKRREGRMVNIGRLHSRIGRNREEEHNYILQLFQQRFFFFQL